MTARPDPADSQFPSAHAGEAPAASPPPWTGPDRRSRPTPMFSRYTFRGRRRRNQRAGDPTANYYTDWMHGPYRSLVIGMAAFILVDALATLEILSRGFTEANPLMAALLEHGVWPFVVVKSVSALAAVLLFAVHRHFKWMRALAGVVLTAYATVVLYHLFLLVVSGA